MNAQAARERAAEYEERRILRTRELAAERDVRAQRPVVIGAALVLPAGFLARAGLTRSVGSPVLVAEQDRRQKLALEAVATAERLGGRVVAEHPDRVGYDLETSDASGGLELIAVKARPLSSPTLDVTVGEALSALNAGDDYRLALVDFDQGDHPNIRAVRRPFDESLLDRPAARRLDWNALWNQGAPKL